MPRGKKPLDLHLPPTGGKLKEIDWEKAIALAECQCSQPQIAHACRVAISTLVDAVKREFGMTWKEWYELHAAHGLTCLRSAQFSSALGGNITMQIFLGKNLLGQSDNRNLELTGKNGGPIDTRQLPATDNWIKGLLGTGEEEAPPAPSED